MTNTQIVLIVIGAFAAISVIGLLLLVLLPNRALPDVESVTIGDSTRRGFASNILGNF